MGTLEIENRLPDWLLIEEDISELESILLDADGRLRVVNYDEIRRFSQNQFSVFCVRHAVYQIVTSELVEFVRSLIPGNSSAIEIGAGNGCLGRALGLPLTDSRQQEEPEMIRLYEAQQQAVIKYPPDVERIEALRAVRKYRPEAVVASWVTHKFQPGMPDGNKDGVNEIALSRMIKRYVFVGNKKVHRHKPLALLETQKQMLRNFPDFRQREYTGEWLVSRTPAREDNVIWVFDFQPFNKRGDL